jgi:hypothetical protein
MNSYTVQMLYDSESGTWYTDCDIPGLILGADTAEILLERVKLAAPEIMELNGVPPGKIRFLREVRESVVA